MIETVFWIGVFLILILLGVMVFDTHRFVTKETTLQSEKIKKDTTVVVLSDLHNKTFGKENCRLMEAIDKCRPDMILIAGDMLNAHPGVDFSETVVFLKALAQKYKTLTDNENLIIWCSYDNEYKFKNNITYGEYILNIEKKKMFLKILCILRF